MSEALAFSADERQVWSNVYEHTLRQSIVKSTQFIRQHHRQPDHLRPHLHSYIEHLNRARFLPDLHDLAVELIAALHPWPTRWGYWDEWEPQIRFAMRVAARQNDPTRQAQFGGYLASILFHTGRTAETRQVIEQAVGLARSGRSPAILAELGNVLIPLLLSQSRAVDAQTWLDALQEGVSALTVQHRPPLREQELAAVWLDMQRFNLLRRAGHAQESWTVTNDMIRRLEALSAPPLFLLAESYNARGITSYLRADYLAAIADMNRSIELFGQEGDAYSVASVTGNLGHLYWSMGDLDRAQQAALECARMTEKLGAQWRLMMSLLQLMVICLAKKQFEQALKHCQRRLDMEARLNYPAYILSDRLNHAEIRLYLGEREPVEPELQALWADQGVQSSPDLRGRGALCLSHFYALADRPAPARQFAECALEVATENGSKTLRIAALRCLAQIELPDRAVDLLQQALALARESNRKFEQAACLLSLAGLTGDEADQCALWEQGSDLLYKMGAAAWVDDCSPQNPPFLPLMV